MRTAGPGLAHRTGMGMVGRGRLLKITRKPTPIAWHGASTMEDGHLLKSATPATILHAAILLTCGKGHTNRTTKTRHVRGAASPGGLAHERRRYCASWIPRCCLMRRLVRSAEYHSLTLLGFDAIARCLDTLHDSHTTGGFFCQLRGVGVKTQIRRKGLLAPALLCQP